MGKISNEEEEREEYALMKLNTVWTLERKLIVGLKTYIDFSKCKLVEFFETKNIDFEPQPFTEKIVPFKTL